MFHNIPARMAEQMHKLEALDAQDRTDGTPRASRLRQIPPETGRFLALLAANAPEGQFLEIGTSAGYSTLWISLAATLRNRHITTFEILPEKVKLARKTFRAAGIESTVDLIREDALRLLPEYSGVAFCFLDAEKEVYAEVYETIIPRLVPGGILAADNAINHRETLQPMLDRALNDERVDAMILAVGKGVLVCRKI
jgi:caffeoyl-CoA O-methyltransferase